MTVGANLLAGAGKSAIDIAYPVEGFVGEHDPLYARVTVLGAGPDRAAVAVIDLTSVPADLVDDLRQAVGRAAGVDPAQVFVCASHTFSAPHLSRDEGAAVTALRSSAATALARAAAQAAAALRPARLGFGRGTSRVNVNRDVPTAEGWWLGANEDGITDQSVAVIRIDGLDGHPVVILANYAVQPSVMNESMLAGGGKLVTGDLAGAAVRHVEEQYGGGTVAMFLIGAAGDQAPYLTANRHTLDKDRNWSRTDLHDAGHVLVDLLGERLGNEVVRVSERVSYGALAGDLRVASVSVEVLAQRAPASFRDLRPVLSYDFQPDGTETVPVAVMLIGDVALVGLQAELSSRTGLDIKARSPFDRTVVMTMVNGGAKYMADAGSYDKITYAAMNSRYARGTAELVSARILELLAGLAHGDRQAARPAAD
jgi:neutral ceramidase